MTIDWLHVGKSCTIVSYSKRILHEIASMDLLEYTRLIIQMQHQHVCDPIQIQLLAVVKWPDKEVTHDFLEQGMRPS